MISFGIAGSGKLQNQAGWELAILNENIQAFFHRERGVEDDEAETQREDIVAGADLQEIANGTLFDAALVKIWMCAGHLPQARREFQFRCLRSPLIPLVFCSQLFLKVPSIWDVG